MSQLAIGIIETIGLAAAIEVADVCLKSANVSLIGYELTKGNGMTVVKIKGNVGAVKAAIEAASVAVDKVSKIYSKIVIPRPSDDIELLIINENTVGYENENSDINSDEIEELSSFGEAEQNETKEDINDIEDCNIEDCKEEFVESDNENEIEEYDEQILEYNEDEDIELKDDSLSEIGYTCNICKDPKCKRVKGDLRSACIHYDERKEK